MKTHLFFACFAVLGALLFGTNARAQMSDTEKKAAARAAYQEGVKLQDEGKAADALVRFESAQKLFDAPTHLLHIAECQALVGRLVEASETYETLARKTLPPGSPDAFVQAQSQGQAELAPLRARIPTLRVTVRPGPQQVQNLAVNVNGVSMPNELLGIARPLNPGTYRFTAQAVGWSTTQHVDVPLAEKEQKSVELTMQQASGAAPVIVGPPMVNPAPPPYTGNNPEQPKPKPQGPTSSGLLFGVRGSLSLPGGDVFKASNDVAKLSKMSDNASMGGAFGIDGYARLAKMLLIGATFEYAGLGTPDTVPNVPAGVTVTSSAHATYIGVNLGILPSVDHVSFIGDVGLGSRTLATSVTGGGSSFPDTDRSYTGLEFAIGAGISCPVGPIRLVPRANLGVGSFSSAKATIKGVDSSADIPSGNRSPHTFLSIALAAYYSFDIGQKTE